MLTFTSVQSRISRDSKHVSCIGLGPKRAKVRLELAANRACWVMRIAAESHSNHSRNK